MIVRELLTKLGFKTDQKALDQFNKGMTGAKKNMQLAVGVASAIQVAMVALANSASDAGDKIAKTSSRVDIASRKYQELIYTGERFGVEQQTINQSLAAFSRRIGAAALGTGPAVNAYKEMGIQLHDSNGELRENEAILRDVVDSLSGMEDQAIRTQYADSLFSEAGRKMVDMLSAGNTELDEIAKNLEKYGYIMDEKALKASEEFADTMLDMKYSITGVKNMLGVKLFPVITKMVDRFKEWIAVNKDWLALKMESTIRSLARAADMLWAFLSYGIRAISTVVGWLGGLENVVILTATAFAILTGAKIISGIMGLMTVIKTLTGTAAVMNAVVGFLPILISAIIVAIALLVEDIYQWVNGQDSLIGKFLGPWEAIRQTLVDIWNDPWQAAKDFFSWLVNEVPEMLKNIPVLGEIFKFGGWLADATGLTSLVNGAVDLASPYVQDIGAANTGGKSSSLNVNSTVNVAVPEGTPQQQKVFVEQAAKDAVKKEWQSIMNQGYSDIEGVTP